MQGEVLNNNLQEKGKITIRIVAIEHVLKERILLIRQRVADRCLNLFKDRVKITPKD